MESLVDGEVRMGGSFRGSRTLKSSGNAGKISTLYIRVHDIHLYMREFHFNLSSSHSFIVNQYYISMYMYMY